MVLALTEQLHQLSRSVWVTEISHSDQDE